MLQSRILAQDALQDDVNDKPVSLKDFRGKYILLDPDGKIIAKNLRGEELSKKLEGILGR